MNVYLLMHDEGMDAGLSVRGVYLTEAAAEADVVTRTASGRPSMSFWAHGTYCCSVEEREVLDAPLNETHEDDPPPDPNAPRFVPDSFVDAVLAVAVTPSPYRRIVPEDEG